MSERKTRFRAAVCIVLAAALLCMTALSASAETLEELQGKQEALQQMKEDNEEKLEELREKTDQKRAYRDALYGQIDTVQGQLDLLRQQIDELNARITRAEDQIAEKQAGIDQNLELLKERVKALYITGDASTLSIVLGSENLMDFVEKIHFLRAVTKHDQKLIDRLTGQMEEIRTDLDEIYEDKKDLSERKKELDARSAELTELYEEAQSLVEEAENDELNARADSELLTYRMEENEAAIAELEEQIRKEQMGNPGGSGYVGTGSFIWPMPGYTYLTCYFGEGGHRGVDIAGGDIYGKPIVAADGGTVTYAGWNDSYGYCVFIDHGNGYETRYAHMSSLGTDTGAAVEQGQIIGYVGSTGNSTGPHLHFEVIRGWDLTDPMGYF